MPECSVRTLIAADKLSRCAPQPNLIYDWLGVAGWLLQMGSSSSSCHREDNILLSNYNHPKRKQTGVGVRNNWERKRSEQMLFREQRDYCEHPQREREREEGWE